MDEENTFEAEMRKQFESDVEAVMKTPEGRRLLLGITGCVCRVNRNCFEATARETDYALGRRSVGLELNRLMDDLTPDEFLLGQKEYRALHETLKHKTENA